MVESLSNEDKAIQVNHYENLREDVRSEIKLRISQRDNFAIQMITMLGLLCSVGFADKGFGKVIMIAPLLSIFYTMQILYSYRLHDLLAKYLRDVLEPKLVELCGGDINHEWEYYYKNLANAKPGIRRAFFLWAMWVVSACSFIYLYIYMNQSFFWVLSGALFVYIVAKLYITFTFIGDITKKGAKSNERSSHETEAQL